MTFLSELAGHRGHQHRGYIKADLISRSGGWSPTRSRRSRQGLPGRNWVSDINLKTSNPAVAKLRIPVSVNVVATWRHPEAVKFGDVALGSTPEKKVTLQGGTPFKILKVNGVDEQLKVVIEKSEASEVHTIVLAANPQAMGGFTRNVEIVTDNKDQPKIIVR